MPSSPLTRFRYLDGTETNFLELLDTFLAAFQDHANACGKPGDTRVTLPSGREVTFSFIPQSNSVQIK